MKKKLRIAFFGTPSFATAILDELKDAGYAPLLIVTQPDKPHGRNLVVTPPDVKVWAEKNAIEIIQPHNLTDDPSLSILTNSEWDIFIVAAYGHLIPKHILDIPAHGTLNVHPSLLPKLRGPSPVRSAILMNQKDAVGVSVMALDEKMDHGPIIAQARIEPETWPMGALILEDLLAHEGGKLLAEALPLWVKGDITPEPQNETEATYCSKITKPMGEIQLDGNPHENFRKIKAFEGWPGTYFFIKNGDAPMRVKIVEADMGQDDILRILQIIPEGKAEMRFDDFMRNRHP